MLGSAAALAADQRPGRERQVLVSAALSSGAPATGLSVADFVVREDGLSREITKVSPAPPPSHVLLLVDDSQAAEPSIPFLRAGLAAFIKKVAASEPAPQIGLMTFGDRPTKRADFSPTAAAVEQAAGKIFATPGSGAYFLQAVMDGCADLRKKSAASPVIVAFVAEAGPEFSSVTHNQVADSLKSCGASLWVIALQSAGQVDQTREAYERASVTGDVTRDSGGLTRALLSNQALQSAYDAVATLIMTRYQVTYAHPDQTIPPTALEVTSKRADVKLASTRWIR